MTDSVLLASSAAAAAKLLQSCPTLCNPIDSSPPGSPVPGILQARTLEWVAISFFNAWKWKVKVKSLSRVRPSVTPWTAAFQAPPSMGFSRQEYWSGVPLPSPLLPLHYLITSMEPPIWGSHNYLLSPGESECPGWVTWETAEDGRWDSYSACLVPLRLVFQASVAWLGPAQDWSFLDPGRMRSPCQKQHGIMQGAPALERESPRFKSYLLVVQFWAA